MEQKLLEILKNCRNGGELMQTHLQIVVRGLDFLLPKLVEISAAKRSLVYADQVFRSSKTHNLMAYNNMIRCFAGSKSCSGALSTYSRMRYLNLTPNSFTFTSLLGAMESPDHWKTGNAIHGQIIKYGCESSLFVQNTLLVFYSKCTADLTSVRRMFDEMPEKDTVSYNSVIHAHFMRGEVDFAVEMFESMPERSIISWNSTISGLCKIGEMSSAQRLFDRMKVKNVVTGNAMISGYAAKNDMVAAEAIFSGMAVKDVVSWTAMLSGYTKNGNMEAARSLFDRMPAKNTVSWNAMISGYNENRRFDRALEIFQEMLIDGMSQPDDISLIAVSCACGHLGSLDHANWVFSFAKKNAFEISLELGNALVDMFAKCGNVKTSEAVFNQMAVRCVISWTTMIWALGAHGRSSAALNLFDEMRRGVIQPDDVTFIAVLSACAHGGLVEEGKRKFQEMVSEYGIEPRMEHYGCMVDLLARAGRVKEAADFIDRMPVDANSVLWATLLSSRRLSGELTELVGKRMAALEPLTSGYQVLLSNSSAQTGRWGDVSSIRGAMWQDGMEKVPGCSSIQVDFQIYEFMSKDVRHERRGEIYDVLNGLIQILRHACHHHPWQISDDDYIHGNYFALTDT